METCEEFEAVYAEVLHFLGQNLLNQVPDRKFVTAEMRQAEKYGRALQRMATQLVPQRNESLLSRESLESALLYLEQVRIPESMRPNGPRFDDHEKPKPNPLSAEALEKRRVTDALELLHGDQRGGWRHP